MLNRVVVLVVFLLFAISGLAQHSVGLEAIKQLIEKRDFEHAEEQLGVLLDESPGNAELHYLYGVTLNQRVSEVSVFRKLGYARRGRQALEKAVDLDPGLALAWKELSDYYYYAPAIGGGDKGKAAELLNSARDFDEPLYWLTLGNRALNEGRVEEARNYYLELTNISPDNPQALVQLGVLSRRSENFDAAHDYFDRALAVDSDHVAAYFQIGLLGIVDPTRQQVGIDALKRYIGESEARGSSLLDQAFYRLGNLYELAGDNDRARESYESALVYNPELDVAQDRLEAID